VITIIGPLPIHGTWNADGCQVMTIAHINFQQCYLLLSLRILDILFLEFVFWYESIKMTAIQVANIITPVSYSHNTS
jgi:hypothetical protein